MRLIGRGPLERSAKAMRSLFFIGAIRIRQGSGTYVSSIDDENVERLIGLGLMVQRSKVREVIEARRIPETQASGRRLLLQFCCAV